MKTKRKLIVSLVTLTLLLCCSLLFVACNDEVNNYTVAFKVDGKNYDIVLVEEGKPVTLPSAPQKDGYAFDGWFTDKACMQSFTASAVSQSIDLYAKFTANVYTITYEADGGTHDNVTSFTVEDKVILSSATKSGYAFEGWYMDGYRISYIPKGTVNNVTLTAKYIKNGYTVTYKDLYGADNPNPDAFSVESDDIVLKEPYLSGYEFIGWYDNEQAEGDPITVIPKGSVGDVTLYAKFELIVCNVTFSGVDGVDNEYNEIDPTYSAQKNFYLSDVSKEGYTFDGWYDRYDMKVEYLPFGDNYDNVTLTAKWTPITYRIDYENCNGADNSQNPVSFTFGSGDLTIGDLEDTIDYEFKGWSFMNSTPEKDFTFASSAAFDVTLVAVWEQKQEYKGLEYYISTDKSKVIISGVTDTTLTSVTVPDETNTVLKGAFKNLTSLKSISLPFVGKDRTVSSDSTLSYLFDGNVPSSLKTVTITGGETIAGRAFYQCQSIENVTITGDVTTIGKEAFYDCNALEMLDIKANVTSIAANAFRSCDNLLQVKLPASLTEIKNYAFLYCSSLIEVYNPSQVNVAYDSYKDGELGYYTKHIYTSLEEPSKLYYDEDGNLFYKSDDGLTLISYKSDNTEYIIPSNVEIIHDAAFKGRQNLTSVTLSSSLKKIGNNAFENCNAIASLNITTDGLVVGDNAFNGSTALTALTVSAKNVTIGNSAFKNCANLGNITLTGKGVKVGNEAFSGCKQKASLDITAEDSEFGSAFQNWNELETLTISAKNSKFTDTFKGTSLKEVTISGDGVNLAARVFEGISTLTKVTFTGNGIVLGNNDSFKNCTSLTDVLFQGTGTSIGGYSFYHCTALETITLGSGIESIGEGAFEGCSALSSVTFNDDLTSIGNKAFYECVKLSKLEFPTSLEQIGNETFKGLNLLTKITFPQSLTIGEKTFLDCRHLREVNFLGAISIGNEAFSGCILSEVVLPAETTYTSSSLKNCCNDNVAFIYYYGTSAQIKSASELGLGDGSRLYYYNENPEYNANNSAFIEDYWHFTDGGKIETGDSKKVTFSTTYGRAPNSGSSIDTLFDGKKSEDGLYIVQVNSIAWQVVITVWLSRSVALKSFTITTGRGADYSNRVPHGFRVQGGTMDGGSVTILDKYGDSSALPKENYKSVKFDGQADDSVYLNTLSFTFAMPQNRDDQNNMELAEIELEFWPVGWDDRTITPLSYKAIDGDGTFMFVTNNNNDTTWNVSRGELILENDEAIALGSYSLEFGDGNKNRFWSIYGSNDDYYFSGDDKWTVITEISWAYGSNFYYYLQDNTTKYKYYKFSFTSNMSLKKLKISSETKAAITYEAVKGTAGTKDSEDYDKVTDGDTSTKWCVNVSSNKRVEVIIKTSIKAILKGITITTANDTASYPERNPIKFSFGYADTDDCVNDSFDSWTHLQQSEIYYKLNFEAENYKSYSFSTSMNTEAHQYYRFEFTAQDEATLMQISEITLEFQYAS